MIRNQEIICFSTDWHQDPLSKHHVLSRLARENRVLWVNSIGMRAPTVSRKDGAKVWAKLRSFARSVEQVQENLYVISPLVIPFHGNRLAAKLNGYLLVAQVRHYQKKLGLLRPILWSFLPNIEETVGHFQEQLLLYYITDDFTQFTGHPGESIARMEERLIRKCDLTIASATRLAKKKAVDSKPIHLVSHGVNHEHFARALSLRKDDWPPDIKDVKHPIIGFYGEINDWLDLSMLAQVAEQRPDWSFVMLGRIAVEVGNIDYLMKLPNVHWLGQKKFSDLPAYCAAFDVALIPMKINELTLNVNPLKLREYLAAGVPVVSTPLPEVLPYSDVVRFGSTAEEFVEAIEEALKDDRKHVAPRLSQRVASEGWDAKVEEISMLIQRALEGKRESRV